MDRKKLLRRFIIGDVLASLIAWIFFMVFRKTVVDAQIFQDVQIFVPNYDFLPSFIYFPLSCLFVYFLSGYYRKPENHTLGSVLFSTFTSTALVSFSIFFILMLDDKVVSYEYYYYSLMVLFALLSGFTMLFRIIDYMKIRRAFKTKNGQSIQLL